MKNTRRYPNDENAIDEIDFLLIVLGTAAYIAINAYVIYSIFKG